jgi:uncharacterized protein (TIGR02118 family)
MVRITICYPNRPGARFDLDYYVTKHFALVVKRFGKYGLKRTSASRGVGGLVPGSPAEAMIQGQLDFDTMENLQAAMAAEGAEVLADIANYTDIQPRIQIDEVLA